MTRRVYADFTGAARAAEEEKRIAARARAELEEQGLLKADNDNELPKLLVIGDARHGKDTVAEILRDEYGFSFISSSYFAGEKVVRPALAACGITYASMEECYEDRVNWRAFWYEAIKAYNGGGKSRLAEEILEEHDMYVGMRSGAEFEASRHLFDYVLWVDASGRGVPPEPRDSFDIDFDRDTMFWIDNGGTLEDLRKRVQACLAFIAS